MTQSQENKCSICQGQIYYLNCNGEYLLCPRCDILRLAEMLKNIKVSK